MVTTRKTLHVGKESGKSSARWFGNPPNPNNERGSKHMGDGARAGDGKTSDTSILGKIVPKFLRGS